MSVEAGNDEGTAETHKISKSQGPRIGCPRCGAQTTWQQTVFTKIKNAITVGK